MQAYNIKIEITHEKEDVSMGTVKEEGAINLSTELGQKLQHESGTSLSPLSTTNGSMEHNSQGPVSPQPDSKSNVLSAGLNKRKPRPPSESTDSLGSPTGASPHQSLLSLVSQHGMSPAQLQQMLLAQGAGVTTPPHLQLLQAQHSAVLQQQQKAHEAVLLQLNEQLQINLMQQSQLIQDKKTNGKQTQQQLQQLAIQQQTIVSQIQQIQLQQRQLLLACLMQPFSAQHGGIDGQNPWKDHSDDDDIKPNLQNGLNLMNGSAFGMNSLFQGSMMGLNGFSSEAFPFGAMIGQPAVKTEEGMLTPLYKHGVCKWPGCDTGCSDFNAFNKHLNEEHMLDDKNTAQARVQMQIVSQLEIQLTREKGLLHAMMQHLHLQPHRHKVDDKLHDIPLTPKHISSIPVHSSLPPHKSASTNSLPTQSSKNMKIPSLPLMSPAASVGLPPLVIPQQTILSSHQSQSQPTTPTSAGIGPMRRRVSDKCNLPISAGEEIQRNREFYKNTDVRPPFTYASLIRQAIIESENKQLTLNEVYQWFQSTFAYFRRNEATWKNAVRHNLSLHKCFMRVENVKGAVWTVDEVEFYKRRPQKLTGAVAGSVPFMETSLYADAISAGLRAKIHQNSFPMLSSNGLLLDGVEDLSMKSLNNSNDSFSIKSPRDEMFLRHDSYGERMDELNGSSPTSFGSNQGLDLSPLATHRTSPAVPSASGSPLRRSEDQLSVPGIREGKFMFTIGGGGLDGYPNSSIIRDNTNSPRTSDNGSATAASVRVKLEPSELNSADMEDQDEALNMSVDRKSGDGDSERVNEGPAPEDNSPATPSVSPSHESLDLRRSPLEQTEMNMSYLHRNNLLSVSHSMT